jgi:hypothetical protein
MIRYTLACDNGHEFESWFPGSDAFDQQVRRGLVECPSCRSTNIRKSIMAPALSRGSNEPELPPVAPDTHPVVMDERLVAPRMMVRDMRDTIARTTRDVGAAFPEEARKMHFGETEHQPIRGEASPDEARALIDEGVPILWVPVLPDERN